jgi:hypothetical protein
MPERFRVVGTGSREWPYPVPVYRVLDELLLMKGFVFLAQGGARGADTIIKQWCIGAHMKARPHAGAGTANPVQMKTFPANWRPGGVFDRTAGLSRNETMVDQVLPDLVLAFVHEGSRGSMHCANYAISKLIETIIFRSDGSAEYWVDGEKADGCKPIPGWPELVS